jgi:transcriptional regulator with XRE-family HTH domain
MNYARLASEVLRAIRGGRSQVAASRRLGYRSNVFANWENGRRFPTASELMRGLRVLGMEPARAVRALAVSGEQGAVHDLTTADGVAAWLRHHRGTSSLEPLARRVGKSRFAVSRWLSGQSEPRLPDFLGLLDAMTLRVLDFVSALVDPRQLPVAVAAWERLERRRRLAYDLPDTEIVLLALELDTYRALPAHRPGWITSVLGLAGIEEEERCLRALEQVGAITWNDDRWRVDEVMAVDTSRDPGAVRSTKAHWSRMGLEQILAGAPGRFSYNVFTVSSEDLRELEAMYLEWFAELRRRVARSGPSEHVVVANLQLFALDHRLEGPKC